jgi:hypothetical protein
MSFHVPPVLAKFDIAGLVAVAVLLALFFLLTSGNKSQLPLVNNKRPLEFGIAKARQRYLKDAHNLIMGGLAKVC